MPQSISFRYTDAQSSIVKRLSTKQRTDGVTSCHHPLSAHAHARRSRDARLRICMQVGYSCTCSSVSVLDRLQAYMQGCTYACKNCATAYTHARLNVRMQESTCACMVASTHARLHVCMQELHDCTHTRKLDLCRHAQSAHQL